MSRWLKRSMWFGAMVCAAGFGHWLAIQLSAQSAARSRKPLTDPSPIELTGTTFGEVLEDSEFSWTVQLHNRCEEDIEVARITPSCDCVGITPQSLRLPGGAAVPLKLTIDLARTGPQEQSSGAGRKFQTKFSLLLACKRGNDSFAHDVSVSGTVRSVLKIDPKDLRLGDFSVVAQPLTPLHIPVKAVGPEIQSMEATVEEKSAWRADILKSETEAWNLRLSAPSSLPIGQLRIPVRLIAQTADGVAVRRLTFVGCIVEDVEVSPATFVLGPATIGTDAVQTIHVRSRSGRNLVIDRVSVDDVSATADFRRGDQNNWEIRVKQKVALQGKQQRKLTVVFSDVDGTKYTVECKYWYYGRS